MLIYRFSSGDLSSELEDGPDGAPMGSPPAPQSQPQGPQPLATTAPPPTSGPPGPPNSGDLSLNLTKQSSRTTSAPSSPAKTRESLLQRVQSLTGVARDQGASLIGNVGTYHSLQLFNDKAGCYLSLTLFIVSSSVTINLVLQLLPIHLDQTTQ